MSGRIIRDLTRGEALFLAHLGPKSDRPGSIRACRVRTERAIKRLTMPNGVELAVPLEVARALKGAASVIDASCSWCGKCGR